MEDEGRGLWWMVICLYLNREVMLSNLGVRYSCSCHILVL